MSEGPPRAGSSHPNGSPPRNANPIPSLPTLLSQQGQSGGGGGNVNDLVTGSGRNEPSNMDISLPAPSLPPSVPPPSFPLGGHDPVQLPPTSDQYAVESHARSYDPNRGIDPHRRTPSMPPSTSSLPMSIDNLLPSQSTSRPLNEAFQAIAPRKPGSSHPAPRGVPKPQRAKRRRLIGAGRHWAPAVDKFVHDIPPVPYFSDPRRNAPQRDMRGWITTISKPAQKLVWDRLMSALTQDDLNDNGDEDICRHILGSVVHEAQDPTSEKRQTRQAVNNAIKRELSLPKATGQTGRGETFRELFREKAMGAGFRLTPVEKGDKDHSGLDDDMGISGSVVAGPSSHDVGSNLLFHNGDPRMSGVRRSHSQNSGTSLQGSMGIDSFGFNAILDAAEASRWNGIIRSCEKTAAGETAWWTSTEMKVADQNHLAQYLVRMGKVSELKRLLVDFRWLRKLAISSNQGIMLLVKKGFDVLLSVKTAALSSFEREGYRLIRNALMLVTPILRPQLVMGTINDSDVGFCAHLGTQLFGRLLNSSRKFAVVATLLESIRTHVQPPWLRPLNPCFDAPKTDIALAVKSGPGALASAVAISADGELLVTTGIEMRGVKQNVCVWEVATGTCLSTIPVESVLMLAISPNRKHVVSVSMGNEGPLMFWTIIDDKRRYIDYVREDSVTRATLQRQTIFSVVITPDSKYVISACENAIIKWNISNGMMETNFKGVNGTIYSMDLSPDGKLLVAGTAQGVVGLWTEDGNRVLLIKNEGEISNVSLPVQIKGGMDLKGGKLDEDMTEIKGSRVFSVSFMMKRTPVQGTDERFKIVSGGQGIFRIWTLPKLEQLLSGDINFELTQSLFVEGLGIINNMRCTDDKSIFFASGDGLVRLWKLAGGKIDNSMKLGTEPPMRFTMEDQQQKNTTAIFLAVSDDGQKVAASTERPFVLVWDVGQYEETLKEQKELRDQPYFPCNPGSVSFTDIISTPRVGLLHAEFNKYLSNAMDSTTELRILRKKENDNDLKLVFHPYMEERSIVFDQNIDLDHCRVGVFIKPETGPMGPTELETPVTAEQIALDRREGVGVRFKDKNIAFFEAERGIAKLRLQGT